MNVFNIFSRTPPKLTVGNEARLYVRDGKPSALQGWFFSPLSVDKIGAALADSGIVWIWESTRTGPPASLSNDEVSPEHRPRQLVSDDLVPVLKADLFEKNLHGFRRFVALYGGRAELAEKTSDDDLRNEVEAFVRGDESLLSVLVVQLGDVAPDVIYFRQRDGSEVDLVLQGLGLSLIREAVELPYKELKGEDLETVTEYLSCAEHDH